VLAINAIHQSDYLSISHPLLLGVLDNSKWKANKLLRGALAALGQNIKFAAENYYVKHSFSKDAARS
jgi:hypothetical protein